MFVKWWPSNSLNQPGAGDDKLEINDKADSEQGTREDDRSRVIEAVLEWVEKETTNVGSSLFWARSPIT